MKRIYISTCLAIFIISCARQSTKFDYFGLPSPGKKIEIFAPGIVSLKDIKEKSLAISPLGDEVFFSGGRPWPESKIMLVKKVNNKWGNPVVAGFSSDCYATEPAFSHDGKYLYYSSSKGMKDIKRYSIWRVKKTGDEWSDPERIVDFEDPNIWEFHPSVTRDGTVYFCYWDSQKQAGSIYKSKFADGVYSKPEKITLLFKVPGSDTDPFIDPDEKYLISSSTGQNGKGGYDVYISYNDGNGSWSEPINAGDKFNTAEDEDSFDISPDGRFVFMYKQNDVYWTEAKKLFDGLKK